MSGVSIGRMLTLWGRSTFAEVLERCYCGCVNHIIDLACRTGFHRLQGTKVLEDREIRHRFCTVSEDAPPQRISHMISKYTGKALVSPEWRDVEEGAVFTP